jgi:hypothetical protein
VPYCLSAFDAADAAEWSAGQLSAETAPDLRLPRDTEELTGQLAFLLGASDSKRFSRRTLEGLGNRIHAKGRGGAPDLGQLLGNRRRRHGANHAAPVADRTTRFHASTLAWG